MVLLSALYLLEVYKARLTFTTQTETGGGGGRKVLLEGAEFGISQKQQMLLLG